MPTTTRNHPTPAATRADKLLSIPRAAEACGISPTTLKKLIADGVIKATRPSVHQRVKLSDIRKHLAEREECVLRLPPPLPPEAESLLTG